MIKWHEWMESRINSNIGYHFSNNIKDIEDIKLNHINFAKLGGFPDFTIGFWVIRKGFEKSKSYGKYYVGIDLSNLNILKFKNKIEFDKFLDNFGYQQQTEIRNYLIKSNIDAVEFGSGFNDPEYVYEQGYILIINISKIKIIN